MSFIGDRFIFRLPTPPVTVGGGTIIDILDHFPHKKELSALKYLNDRMTLSAQLLIETELQKSIFVKPDKDFIWSNYSAKEIEKLLKDFRTDGIIGTFRGKIYLIKRLEPLFTEIIAHIKDTLEKHSHVEGLAIDTIARGVNQTVHSLEPLLELMCAEGLLEKKKNRYDLPDRTISVKGEVKIEADKIEKELLILKFKPPLINDLVGKDKIKKEAFEFLLLTNKVVKAGVTMAFHRDVWFEIINIIYEIMEAKGELAVGEFRERLDSTRKFIIPILEETDRRKITLRQGDVRVKGENYGKE
ncbi:MAG: SelB C-terminal domain-containing protein, partial [Candidatus Zixiibacteriota bacterium]